MHGRHKNIKTSESDFGIIEITKKIVKLMNSYITISGLK
jgi:hypothetical protein